MCFKFSFKSPQCLPAPIPPPAPLSGLQSVWMEKNRHTQERVMYGEPSGLGIISGSHNLPATCRPIRTGGTRTCRCWPCPGWAECWSRTRGRGGRAGPWRPSSLSADVTARAGASAEGRLLKPFPSPEAEPRPPDLFCADRGWLLSPAPSTQHLLRHIPAARSPPQGHPHWGRDRLHCSWRPLSLGMSL